LDELERREVLNNFLKDNRIYGFGRGRNPEYPELRDPNPLQKRLLDAWDDPKYKVFTYCGANRIGKCLTYQTLIDTPDGGIPIGMLFENRKQFDVYAWDGAKRVIARAKAPFKKEGLHDCYRITLADGRWIEAADNHRVLTSRGWIFVEQLQSFFDILLASNSGNGLSVLPSGVVDLSGIPLNYRDGYSEDFRQHDAPLLMEEDICPSFVPLQADALRRYQKTSYGGGLESKYTNKNQLISFLLSSMDVLSQNVGRFFEFLGRDAYNTLLSCFVQFPSIPKFAFASTSPLQCGGEFVRSPLETSCCNGNKTCSPCDTSFNSYNSIININPIGVKVCYDFEVEKYHNYYAGGLINHNTTIGTVIAFSTLFGEWLSSGRKLHFIHKNPRKVLYLGQGWESHVKLVLMPKFNEWWPKTRSLKTKKNNQGIDATWEDTRTGSVLTIMSNNQDSKELEGGDYDLIVYDEPPKRENRIALARGLVDRQGRELFCMTLLSEAWVKREIIRAKLQDGQPDTTVFNINGEIESNIGYGLTKEGVEQFIKTLKPHEIEARIKGRPSFELNLVCPKFDSAIHCKDRYKIPLDALVDISIDFHPSKPWAIQFMATLRNNFKYICEEIEKNGNPKFIGEEIVRIIRDRNYRINNIDIDPLAKGDENNDETVYGILSNTLASYGYSLNVASKDKDNGIAILNNLLWTENEMPGLYVFRDCVKTVEQLENWMYDRDTFKPEKKDDDFCEVTYRNCLKNTQWYPEYKPEIGGKSVIL
jgi:hypothetical protein